ncbi:DUF2971 domain-containing protein [Marinospirillum perlucidum]|uniref:DUF2971 domain-containing protein n=1 Tax=Marinospirillum perlucidum TaxID=1982602 RepID=UPI000DF380B8|nr:DUF2971 domain-containing protein [Marinospirillum perlucidum]
MSINPYKKALKVFRDRQQGLPFYMAMENSFNAARRNHQSLQPDRLSHYCSSEVAIKIFENCIMWLTDIRKMNDKSELLYAINALNDGADNLEIEHPLYKEFPSIIRQDINNLLGNSVNNDKAQDCVSSVRNKIVMATCFSIYHDDANMWRLYGDNAAGVEIRFNSKLLAVASDCFGHFIPNAGAYETGFVKVCYQGDRCDCLQILGNQVIDAYLEAVDDLERSMLRSLIYYSVSDFLMSHKHPSFHGEGEYRLFTHIPINKTWSGSDYLYDHPNGITQYTPFAFGANAIGYRGLSDFLPKLIHSVNLGPHIEEQHKESLVARLAELGISDKLQMSSIPIRK